ncbi:MAG: signal recognition particle protein, partial [Clostridia bacterium]|nr:signal recognition particle protein [Clostridia bacterium]
MAFEGLSEKLQGALKKLTGKGKLNEQMVKEAMREVRMALLEADVNYAVAKDFCKKVTERCVGQEILESLTPGQQVIKIVNEEMTQLMGGSNARLTWSPSVPTIYMLCGLQGAGKTTMAAKLALWLQKQGKKPMLAACDIYRPAAIKQLQVVGEKVKCPVYEKGQQDPVKTAKEAIEQARYYGRDVLIIDTAGRLHVDEALMQELARIKAEVKPQEILLVVDAMTGQDAVNVAKSFNENLGIDGVILTQLDG